MSTSSVFTRDVQLPHNSPSYNTTTFQSTKLFAKHNVRPLRFCNPSCKVPVPILTMPHIIPLCAALASPKLAKCLQQRLSFRPEATSNSHPIRSTTSRNSTTIGSISSNNATIAKNPHQHTCSHLRKSPLSDSQSQNTARPVGPVPKYPTCLKMGRQLLHQGHQENRYIVAWSAAQIAI